MLVYPDSIIQFFKDIPLEPSGVDRVYYQTTALKDAAFNAMYAGEYGAGGVTACTYARENRRRVRVELPISQLYNVNYMRFRNASFENKWFYAFVTSVNYINNVTTEVTYEIDYFTTWDGDFTPSMCYVERQHVEDDTIGANVLEEGIPVGPYINEGVTEEMSGSLDMLLSYFNENGSIPGGTVTQGIYNAAEIFNAGLNPMILDAKLHSLESSNQSGSIVNVFMAPHDFISYDSDNNVSRPVRKEKAITKPYSRIAGYTPKNNKMFVYPYKFLAVDNAEGSVSEYRYEWFNDSTCPFYLRGVITAGCEVSLIPRNYAGVAENVNARLGMSKFPQCAYPVDTYKAYLAQQNAYLNQNVETVKRTANLNAGGSMLKAAVPGALSGATMGAAAGPAGMIIGGIGGAAASAATTGASSLISSKMEEEKLIAENLIKNEIRPQDDIQARGSATTDALAAARMKGFYFYNKCITRDVAESIDNYFTMFGYKISKMRTFNMRARERWTYIKTIGCNIGGNVPASDKAVINGMFDSGIRLWVNMGDVGNFNLSNAPRPIG